MKVKGRVMVKVRIRVRVKVRVSIRGEALRHRPREYGSTRRSKQ